MGNRLGCTLMECKREDVVVTDNEFTLDEINIIYQMYADSKLAGVLVNSKQTLDRIRRVIEEYKKDGRLTWKLETDWHHIISYLQHEDYDIDSKSGNYVVSKNDFYMLWKRANINRKEQIFGKRACCNPNQMY